MSQFQVINESTEDTLESTDHLQEAIALAKDAAKSSLNGDLISILKSDGMAIKQFMRRSDGVVVEHPIAHALRQDRKIA